MRQAERQLAAVVAADIAGYSRLMGADEEGTLARLKACRRDLIDPGIARHRGRTVKTTGDGMLVEFSSPVEAVRWAVEMQHGMIDRNASVAEDRRVTFRVGINLGDVIVDDKDLYGNAVNIAARLESLAEPGGICISQSVHEQTRDRLALPFADGGEQSMKNIARPLRVYALSADAVAALPKAAATRAAAEPLYARIMLWLWPSPKAPSAAVTATAPALEHAVVPMAPSAVPRLSIVVLPFANLSDDREQQYFADGVTEDLTTDLSRIEGSFVISRNTAFTYKDKPVNAKQIGRELGVRYVLEGSVRRSGNQVRVNAQLIDAATDANLWAERFDRDIGDLFALQSEITGRIAIALNFALVRAEAARPTANPDALDFMFRGRTVSSKPPTRDNLAEAIGLYEQALALDPRSAEVRTRLALTLANRVLDGMTETAAVDIARAEGLLGQASTVSPNTPLAHLAKGNLLRAQRRYADAIPEYETVIALDRNSPGAYHGLGQCKFYTASLEQVIPLVEQAIRLSPRDPGLAVWYLVIGRNHLVQSRTDEAIVWLEKARSTNPAHPGVRALLASAYGLRGETERAAAERVEAGRLRGDEFYSSFAQMRGGRNFMAPKVRALYEATYDTGMRKAGMPEK